MSDDETTASGKPRTKRGDAPKAWPNTIEAAARTGFRKKKLDRLVAEGVLFNDKDSAGVTRWDPDLLAIAATVDDESDDESSAPPIVETTAQNVALLKQAHTHLEGALKLVLEPAGAMLKQALAENERLREHIRKLEASHFDLLEAREKILSEQHLRELATVDVQATAARKDRALQLVASNVPKLLAAVNPKSQAVVELLQSLTEDQRGLLLHTDMLTEDQKASVRAVLADPQPKDKAQ